MQGLPEWSWPTKAITTSVSNDDVDDDDDAGVLNWLTTEEEEEEEAEQNETEEEEEEEEEDEDEQRETRWKLILAFGAFVSAAHAGLFLATGSTLRYFKNKLEINQ